MVDLVETMKRESGEWRFNAGDADYKPLPTYYFTLNHKRLKTILDTGAATCYISRDRVIGLIRLRNPCIKVHDVASQGVRLANGVREETSEIASFVIHYGSSSFQVKAFILKLPAIDLILGLPWYKENKPEIDFDTGAYTFNKSDGRQRYFLRT